MSYTKLTPLEQLRILSGALDMLSDALASTTPVGPHTKVEVDGDALNIVLASMSGADLMEAAARASKVLSRSHDS